jgi:hypothetical protein
MTQIPIPNSIDYKELSFDDIKNICIYDRLYDEEYNYKFPLQIPSKYIYNIFENDYENLSTSTVKTVYFSNIEDDSYSDSALIRGITRYVLHYIYVSNDIIINGEYNSTIYRKIIYENFPNIRIFQKL